MPNVTRGRKTREDVIHAGARLFSLHGYFHTSTSDLLEAVTISKGAFYHHFKSKEELALAVVERLQEDYQGQVFDFIPPETPPDRCLWDTLNRIVELNASGQWPHCLLLSRLAQEMSEEDSPLSQHVAQLVNWIAGKWQTLVADAQAAHAVRTDLDPPVLAQLIVTMIFGAVSCRELTEDTGQLDALVRHLKLMAAPPTPAIEQGSTNKR